MVPTRCWPSPRGWTVTFVAAEPGPVPDDRGNLSIVATASYAELPRPDVIVVPGGPGTRKAVSDTALLAWISQAHEHTRWTTSVCSGSFLLGAAGLLKGIKATSHWGWRELLASLGAEPVSERVVADGKIVTAAGVSAGIDMALTLLAQASGATTAQTVQLAIEYAPDPPFDAGSPPLLRLSSESRHFASSPQRQHADDQSRYTDRDRTIAAS